MVKTNVWKKYLSDQINEVEILLPKAKRKTISNELLKYPYLLTYASSLTFDQET